MSDRVYSDRDIRAMKVASLVADGVSQERIKRRLGISSQTEVSRLLQAALQSNWIRKWHLSLPPNAPIGGFDELERLRSRLTALSGRSGEDAPVPIVVKSRHYADHAATHLIELIRRPATTMCAVAWGRTIEALIDAVEARAPEPKEDLVVIPVSGEPLTVRDINFSPTAAARKLAEAFRSKNSRSLAGVAARIPKDLKGDPNEIKEFVSRCGDYAEIFNDEKGLIKRVDMIITGVGDAASSKEDEWFRDTTDSEKIRDLEDFAVGNIAGVWLPKNPNDKDDRNRIGDMNSRWLGIQRADIETCADRGIRNECPGVVLVANDPKKAQIVSRVIGMVNYLLIDERLATSILKLPQTNAGEPTIDEGPP